MIEIIPAVDVLAGKAVRLMHGDYDRVTVYHDDPVAQAKRWVEEGASLVHVVDLDGARSGTPDRALWSQLADAGVAFEIGGGLRTAELAREALDGGATRVVLGTAAVWEPHLLSSIGAIDRVVAAVDVKGDRATGAGWLDEGRELSSVLDALAAAGVDRLLVTGIGRDGTMQGPELTLLDHVIGDGRFQVTASGGVGNLDDIRNVARLGCDEVIVGRALYEGRFTLAQALEVAAQA